MSKKEIVFALLMISGLILSTVVGLNVENNVLRIVFQISGIIIVGVGINGLYFSRNG
jgi:hypothetical protein